jgi:hypothetical protein
MSSFNVPSTFSNGGQLMPSMTLHSSPSGTVTIPFSYEGGQVRPSITLPVQSNGITSSITIPSSYDSSGMLVPSRTIYSLNTGSSLR